MLNGCPLHTRLLTASRDCNPDDLLADAAEEISLLDSGDGVLILTDLYGSTPSNIAKSLSQLGNSRAVSGLNLSMLIRVLNYPEENLHQLVNKAVSGANDGIVIIDND